MTRWGKVQFQPDPGFVPPIRAGAELPDGPTTQLAVWRPPAALCCELPPNFGLAMRCVCCPDGLRRFYPATNWETFVTEAFAGGLAVLCRLRNLSPAQRHSYRLMWLFHQRLRATREHFANRLHHPDSLRVSRAGRGVAREYSILPESLGLDGRGVGQPWSVSRLRHEGWKEARAHGIDRPRGRDCIRFGLLRAARINPLRLRAAESCAGLVRQALYERIELPTVAADSPLAPADTGAIRDAVLERALPALYRHLHQPASDFDAWLRGRHNSFVGQLAKQKNPEGALDKDLVRAALSDLGWDSYRYVADCVDTMMRAYRYCLPDDLTAAEAAWFARMHFKQPYLGDLPLALLVERADLLLAAVWPIWEKPDDPERIAVLHRLLDFYGEMATRRRAIDRIMKARQDGARQTSNYTIECEFDPEHDQAVREPVPELFVDIAEEVRRRRGIVCDCAVPAWQDRLASVEGDQIVIDHGCERCGYTKTSRTPEAEFKALGMAVRTVG
jgi:hypothetical protein